MRKRWNILSATVMDKKRSQGKTGAAMFALRAAKRTGPGINIVCYIAQTGNNSSTWTTDAAKPTEAAAVLGKSPHPVPGRFVGREGWAVSRR